MGWHSLLQITIDAVDMEDRMAVKFDLTPVMIGKDAQ